MVNITQDCCVGCQHGMILISHHIVFEYDHLLVRDFDVWERGGLTNCIMKFDNILKAIFLFHKRAHSLVIPFIRLIVIEISFDIAEMALVVIFAVPQLEKHRGFGERIDFFTDLLFVFGLTRYSSRIPVHQQLVLQINVTCFLIGRGDEDLWYSVGLILLVDDLEL